MYKAINLTVAAAIATATFSAPAIAQDSDARNAVVRYDDLNLTSQADRARLDTRIQTAIRRVCASDTRPTLAQRARVQECEVAAKHGAETQLAALFGAAGLHLASQPLSIVANR